jgi:aldehyde dehydrogenase (NAD+)
VEALYRKLETMPVANKRPAPPRPRRAPVVLRRGGDYDLRAPFFPFAVLLSDPRRMPNDNAGHDDRGSGPFTGKDSAPVDAPFSSGWTARGENYVGGAWRPGSLGTLPMENPSYGSRIGVIARGGEADVDAAVAAAREAVRGAWGRTEAAERGRLLARVAAAVRADAETLAEIESADCGKPTRQARSDAALAARYFEFYAGAADKLHGETLPYQAGFSVMTWREPLGVTAHVIPWNYPLQMTARTLAAALAAGNAAVLKPAEDACLSVVRLFEILHEIGFPPGAVNLVTGLGEEAGAALVNHPGTDHLSFTGSPEVGTRVMADSARFHRPVLLELGGKSPQVVFADADLDEAVPVLVNAIVQNTGQTCSAGSRLLVEEAIHDALVERLAARFRALRVGPAEQDPDVGPLVNARQKDRVEAFIRRALDDGAAVLARAEAPEGPGHFVAPMLLGRVRTDSDAAREEAFGPLLVVIPFRDEAEAVALANDTAYGLVAAVWTRDGSRALRLARALVAGQVFVNTYGAGGGVELPFGGRGRSGFGREKGMEALHHLTAVKTVVIRHG